MADPFLLCPPDWPRSTLEPDLQGPFITHADSGGTPRTTQEEYWDGDIPWLTPRDLSSSTGGMFVSQTERSITKTGLAKSAAKVLPPGTVMLSKRAPIGLVAVNTVPMATNQGLLNFRCGPKLRPAYFAFWLQANRPYLDKVANGSTYPELYKGDLLEFEIAVPSIDSQDRILAVLSALEFATLLGLPLEQAGATANQIVELQHQSQRLSHIQEVLLPALLSGQLDPTQVRIRSQASSG